MKTHIERAVKLPWVRLTLLLMLTGAAGGGGTAMYYEFVEKPQVKAEHTAELGSQWRSCEAMLAVRDSEIERLKGPVKFRAWLEGKECRMVRVHPKNQR